jgi:hypothetical protein
VNDFTTLDSYQGWTPLATGTTMKQPKVARTTDGKIDWQWRTNTPPVSMDDMKTLENKGLVSDQIQHLSLESTCMVEW